MRTYLPWMSAIFFLLLTGINAKRVVDTGASLPYTIAVVASAFAAGLLFYRAVIGPRVAASLR